MEQREDLQSSIEDDERLVSQVFDETLNAFGEYSNEIRLRRQELSAAASSLVNDFEVNSAFFGAPDNSIGLVLAAALELESKRIEGKSDKRQKREIVAAESFAATLFGAYSLVKPFEGLRLASHLGLEERRAILDKYKNVELSERLACWLNETEGDDINDKNHKSYEVIVLNASTSTLTGMLGAHEEYEGDSLDAYITQLHRNAADLTNELGASEEDDLPLGQTSDFGGTNVIQVQEAAARLILEPNKVGYAPAEFIDRDFMIALIKHERAHALGSVSLEDPNAPPLQTGFLGLCLEEYRAEVASGMKFEYAYPEVYEIMSDISIATGVDVRELMSQLPGYGAINKVQFYSLLADKIGLKNVAIAVGLMPENYLDFQPPLSSRVFSGLFSGNEYGFREELFLDFMLEDPQKYIDDIIERLDLSEEVDSNQIKQNYIEFFKELVAELG